MSWKTLAVIALLAASRHCGADDSDAADTAFEDQGRWGRPWLLTEPDYPKAAREQKLSGFVDVVARIAATGELMEVEFRPGLPEAEVFVGAVRDASKYWRLHPPLGRNCLPTQERLTTRVWFELDGEKPRIFVSRGKPQPQLDSALKPLSRRGPGYPRHMLATNREALVFARSEVDTLGNVVAVSAIAFPQQISRDLVDFEEETRRSLGQWKYPPAREGVTRMRYACFDIHFRIKD